MLLSTRAGNMVFRTVRDLCDGHWEVVVLMDTSLQRSVPYSDRVLMRDFKWLPFDALRFGTLYNQLNLLANELNEWSKT